MPQTKAPKACKICPRCGKEFQCERKRAKIRKFCSTRCANQKLPGWREARSCCWCSSPFEAVHNTKKKRFCSNKCRGAWQSSLPYDEWKGKLSKSTANRPRGDKNGMWGKTAPHGQWITYLAKSGETVRLRSAWEHATAIYLDMRGIRWEYEPHRFRLSDRTYCPDFWLPDLGVYWEVKGWFHNRHQETIRQFRELAGFPIVVIGLSCILGIAAKTGVTIKL